MKKIVAFIILVGLIITGCNPSSVQRTGKVETPEEPPIVDQSGMPIVQFSTDGYYSILDEDMLLIQSRKGLQVVNLTTKQVVTEIPSVGAPSCDISGDIVVDWKPRKITVMGIFTEYF